MKEAVNQNAIEKALETLPLYAAIFSGVSFCRSNNEAADYDGMPHDESQSEDTDMARHPQAKRTRQLGIKNGVKRPVRLFSSLIHKGKPIAGMFRILPTPDICA